MSVIEGNTLNRLSRSVPAMLNLLKVAEHGSINKAAEALNMSQPALTRSISRLESMIGAPVFDRIARGVSPTIFGDALLIHARAMEVQLVNTLRDVTALKKNKTGSLRIGVTPLMASHFLSVGLQAIVAEQPDVPVRMLEGTRPQLLGQLRRGELDCVVSTFPFETLEPGLSMSALFTLDLRVIVRADHPVGQKEPIQLQDLANYRWILPRADSDLYKRVERDFGRAGVEFPGSVIETSSMETTRSLVMSTDLVAILPASSVATEIASGQLVALDGDWTFEHRTVGIFLREGEDEAEQPAYQTLSKALRTAYA